MGTATFIWEKVRRLNRVPGALGAYRLAMRVLLRDDRIVTIRRGPVAGMKWRHRRAFQPWMALGLYEPHVSTLLDGILRPDDVFYDIGANAGYFTILCRSTPGNFRSRIRV